MTGPHIDNLQPRLENPMLDDFYKSGELKAEVVAVAEEIKARYLTKLSAHNQTGNLARSAKVTTHRSKIHPDKRWEAEFSVGGGKLDYADDLEVKYGLLASVLNDMGYFQGDGGGQGPTGRVSARVASSRASQQAALRRFTQDSGAINNRLRRAGDPLLAPDPETDADIRRIRDSLSESELQEARRVFRIHSAGRLGNLDELVGKSFPQSGFLSSSSDPSFLDDRQDPSRVSMELEVSPGVRARDISNLSDFGRGESETLIEDGRTIRITEASRDESGVTRVRGVVE